jgi:hypothetical protein
MQVRSVFLSLNNDNQDFIDKVAELVGMRIGSGDLFDRQDYADILTELQRNLEQKNDVNPGKTHEIQALDIIDASFSAIPKSNTMMLFNSTGPLRKIRSEIQM